jgi:dihydrofolate synthase / folylpolyglutamate synthase
VDFTSATSYLLGLINEHVSRRSPNRLDRICAFVHELGDPHLRYPTIHVAGTSGKGSTATMLAAVFTASGRRVGLHTKPHLVSVTERIRIDGIPIAESAFGELLEELMPAIERVAADHGRPTYYETLLAMAFVAFAQAGVDVAVIEAGIGGRLDGTNVLQPRVAIITNVSLDHTEVLGETTAEIARDKAGIAKPGIPLVSDAADPDARREIEAACAAAGAPFIAVGDRTSIVARRGERYGQSFTVTTPEASYELALPVLGPFQQRNAATAICALETLAADLRPTPAQVADGLSRLVIPGRMEFFPSHPSIVFDVAHNPDKAAHLVAALRSSFPERRCSFVIAIEQSKDVAEILRPFAELGGSFAFTTFEGVAGRTAVRPQRLASIAEGLGVWGRAIADPVDAFAVARRSADANDVVVVTGSTFVVATLREWWFANVVSTGV